MRKQLVLVLVLIAASLILLEWGANVYIQQRILTDTQVARNKNGYYGWFDFINHSVRNIDVSRVVISNSQGYAHEFSDAKTYCGIMNQLNAPQKTLNWSVNGLTLEELYVLLDNAVAENIPEINLVISQGVFNQERGLYRSDINLKSTDSLTAFDLNNWAPDEDQFRIWLQRQTAAVRLIGYSRMMISESSSIPIHYFLAGSLKELATNQWRDNPLWLAKQAKQEYRLDSALISKQVRLFFDHIAKQKVHAASKVVVVIQPRNIFEQKGKELTDTQREKLKVNAWFSELLNSESHAVGIAFLNLTDAIPAREFLPTSRTHFTEKGHKHMARLLLEFYAR